MISRTADMKVDNQVSKKSQERNCSENKKEAATQKKDANLGLKVPGSNWERFKSIIAETPPTEQVSNGSSPTKKKKRNRRDDKKKSEHISQTDQSNQHITESNVKENEKKIEPSTGPTKAVAMDCEMVGIGSDGLDSMLARVSIVNRNGICIYDKYVKPTEEVRDYRTAVSGIRPHHLKNGEDFVIVQKEVSEILKGRILVGHALHNDLDVLFLSHPRRLQRDTSRYKLFRKVTKGNTPSLKKLASELLGVDIQSGEHNSIEDAKAAMQLYQLFRKKWETEIRSKR